jgi:hypothetical protein
MKTLFLFALLIISIFSFSQTGKFERIEVQNLKFKNHVVTGISNDASLSSESSAKLVTEQAVKLYVDSHSGGIRRAGGGLTIEGDSVYFGGYFIDPLYYYVLAPDEFGGLQNASGLILDQNMFHVFRGTTHLSMTADGFQVYGPDDFTGSPVSAISADQNGVSLGRYYQLAFIGDLIVAKDGSIQLPNLVNSSPGFRVLKTDENGKLLLTALTSNYVRHTVKIANTTSANVHVSLNDEVLQLPTINENRNLILPDPTECQSKSLYLFNSNISEFNYTLNIPIYKSGNLTVTSIPGNTEFRVHIVSDGNKWLQLN